jgi:hypothetical protein
MADVQHCPRCMNCGRLCIGEVFWHGDAPFCSRYCQHAYLGTGEP